jgi:hypothetical protein
MGRRLESEQGKGMKSTRNERKVVKGVETMEALSKRENG